VTKIETNNFWNRVIAFTCLTVLVTVTMAFVAGILFITAKIDVVNSNVLANSTRITHMENDISGIKSDVAVLKKNQEVIFDRLTSLEENQIVLQNNQLLLQENQILIISALEGAGIKIKR